MAVTKLSLYDQVKGIAAGGTSAAGDMFVVSDTSGTIIKAAGPAITDDTTTAATMYPVWVTANTGNLPLKVTSTKLSWNPSTAILTTAGNVSVSKTTGSTYFINAGYVGQTSDTATSNTTHKVSPYTALYGSIWNGSSADTKGIFSQVGGISGTNTAYQLNFASSDVSSILVLRGDNGYVGIGTPSPAGKVHIAATTGVAAPGSIALAIRDSVGATSGFDFCLEGVSTGDLYLQRVVSGTPTTVMQVARASGYMTLSGGLTVAGSAINNGTATFNSTVTCNHATQTNFYMSGGSDNLWRFIRNGSADTNLYLYGNSAYRLTISNAGLFTFANDVNVSGTLGTFAINTAGKIAITAVRTDLNNTNTMTISDSTALAADVGGGVSFRGKYTTGGSYTEFGSIVARKDNATDSQYGASLAFYARTQGTGGWAIGDHKLLVTSGSSVVLGGLVALATNATDGFTYIPTCAGAPSGTPTAYTGKVALVYDTTNNNMYVYNGGWKKTTTFA